MLEYLLSRDRYLLGKCIVLFDRIDLCGCWLLIFCFYWNLIVMEFHYDFDRVSHLKCMHARVFMHKRVCVGVCACVCVCTCVYIIYNKPFSNIQ